VLIDIIEDLRGRRDIAGQVLYLDASEDVLIRRYSETRRRHPLSPDDTPLTGIAHEIAVLGWDPDLRAKDGRDAAVSEYVAQDARFDAFFAKMQDLVVTLLPAYKDEGKSHLSIGFGCTGGQHRSVAVTEKLAAALENDGWPVSIRHREMERRAGASAASGHTA